MQGGMNNELWLSHSDEVRPQMDLQERVWAELRWEPEADTADVNVTVEDFVATLSGTVPSYHAKMAVAQAAARIPGIRAVRDETVVVPPTPDARADNELATAVARQADETGRQRMGDTGGIGHASMRACRGRGRRVSPDRSSWHHEPDRH